MQASWKLFASALAATWLVSADCLAAPAPVVITNLDSGSVRVLVTEGVTTPCDSSTNRLLFSGELPARAVAVASTEARCVCVTYTRADFPRSGWSPPGFACRPGRYHGRRWIPDPDPTIRITIARPG